MSYLLTSFHVFVEKCSIFRNSVEKAERPHPLAKWQETLPEKGYAKTTGKGEETRKYRSGAGKAKGLIPH